MRIISGRWGGRRLAAVGQGDRAAHLRPTADRVREALFSTLSARDVLEDAVVLDLFAGTGALGLEALSRGARHATFVDNGRAAQKLLTQNIALLGAGQETRILKHDATRLPTATGPAATLVFLDPPYGKGLGETVLTQARRGGWIADGACIVWEEASDMPAPDGFNLLQQRRYGDVWLTVLEAES